MAVSKFSEGSEKLRQAIEEKRAKDASEPVSMRRKLSSARLMINEIDHIQSLVCMAGLPEKNKQSIFEKHARSIISE